MKPRESKVDHLIESYFIYDHISGFVYNKIKRSNKTLSGHRAGCLNKVDGYLYIGIQGRLFSVHRLVWRIYTGFWPRQQIDHINGIRSDNRICNLREATPRENNRNLKIHRNGRLFGCHYFKPAKKFQVQVKLGKKRYFIGYYNTELEAHKQYLRACEAISKHDFNTAKELRDFLNKNT